MAVHRIGKHDEVRAELISVSFYCFDPAGHSPALLEHFGKVVEVVAHQQHDMVFCTDSNATRFLAGAILIRSHQ